MRRPLRRIATVLASVIALVSSSLVIASPAQAEAYPWTWCYNVGNGSFKLIHHSATFYSIDAYGVLNCSSTVLGRAEATSTTSGGAHIRLVAYDSKCDNYGLVVYTAVKSVSSTGCGTAPGVSVTPTELRGYNYHFWVRFQGRNSYAHALPGIP